MSNINKRIKGKKAYILLAALSFVVIISLGFQNTKSVSAADIIVYKSPTCGCCKKWVKHLESAGFNVESVNKTNMNPIKNKFGVKKQYQSCHTAKIGKYFIEGHVPASDIKKLLKQNPDAKGLAVPGMPMGSPGMEGHRKDRYSVLLINNKNKSTVFSEY